MFVSPDHSQANKINAYYGLPLQVAQGISNIHGKRQFTTVTCTDNLSWEVSDVNLKGFSYLFSNAVTTSGMQQPITGNVTFLQGFISDNITTTEWFNGVNLKYLQEDGVFADRPVVRI